MNIYFCHSKQLDYDDFYKAIRNSLIFSKHTCVFPYEKNNVPENSKSIIQKSDLIIAEVSYPGTGLGIELGWANGFHKRIICIYMEDYSIAQSLKMVSHDFIPYQNTEDLFMKLEPVLQNYSQSV